ncbi:MAG: glycerol dehydrogenase [Chloroflexi bacterium RBG_16_56_11]|nr:MAG: glycerol dehydrogenase [Chloroflexi bacterium RBG_16_56_11]
MITTTLFPGRYIQGYGAVKRLGPEVARLGKSAFLIGSNTVFRQILPAFWEELDGCARVVTAKFSGECCDDEIDRLVKLADKAGGEVVIGMGGGKVMDTAKAVAHLSKRYLVIVPTIAASDAPCSAVSVIYTPDGVYNRPMPHPRNPDAVIVDTKIIADAPVRFLVAGMGDALSTWFEAESCRNKSVANMSFTGDTGAMTAYALAHLCYRTVIEYGLVARMACESHSVVPALERVVEANTLLSGLGFESCGLAGAHGIQIGFTALKETEDYLHGEIVAFGTQASLFLTGRNKETIDEVYSFCESVGLPTTLAGIGLPEISDADLDKVAGVIVDKDNPVHNESMPVTRDSVLAAIRLADHYGKSRKSSHNVGPGKA